MNKNTQFCALKAHHALGTLLELFSERDVRRNEEFLLDI